MKLDKPEIEYPCDWSYRVIGRSQPEVEAAIFEVIGKIEYRISQVNPSRTGKFVSVCVELVVTSEQMRLSLLEGLQNHSAVKMVL